ncbi:MAPEG family protein [Sphingomonas swuensis]|uniref:MAPEG family protein n=1 Tax=Sphingomonas swuensis TaxID=977800 RepID=A0ABP7SU70_9SPHN
MTDYPLTIAALLLALAVYVWAILSTGRARVRYKVEAPSCSGDPAFERAFRAQQNTVEQLVLFVPLLALAAMLWGDLPAALFGLVWSLGRILYVATYSADAKKRGPGFLLSAGLSVLVLAGLIVTLALRIAG